MGVAVTSLTVPPNPRFCEIFCITSFQSACPAWRKIARSRTHDAGVYEGCERFFRPGYAMHLVGEWIPALDGVKARLEAGGRVADTGQFAL